LKELRKLRKQGGLSSARNVLVPEVASEVQVSYSQHHQEGASEPKPARTRNLGKPAPAACHCAWLIFWQHGLVH
jgi:hypothetical protein